MKPIQQYPNIARRQAITTVAAATVGFVANAAFGQKAEGLNPAPIVSPAKTPSAQRPFVLSF